MKKYSRNSKRTMKRSMRSKKITRRRRQRGGNSGAVAASGVVAASGKLILIKCTVNKREITATSTDPSITVSNTLNNSLTITSRTPIKNILFGDRAPPKFVGAGSDAIILTDLADNKTVIPQSSLSYTRTITLLQKKLDSAVGMAFPSGLRISGLRPTPLGYSTVKDPLNFDITIIT